MWCIEAKAKIDIPLGANVTEWTNEQFRKFIESRKTSCYQFDKAINWLGNRNYSEAIRDCDNKVWLGWLSSNIPKDSSTIKSGTVITITKGREEKFAIWHHTGIWDLPEEYVGETVRVVSKS